jgi:hypothetical protein
MSYDYARHVYQMLWVEHLSDGRRVVGTRAAVLNEHASYETASVGWGAWVEMVIWARGAGQEAA